MKRFFKYIVSFVVCISMLLCSVSCDTSKMSQETDTTEITTVTENDMFSFDSVNDLITAIKKNPTTYNKKQVNVLGTVIKDDYEGNSYIVDDDDFDFSYVNSSFDVRYYAWLKTQKETNATMSVVITDDVSYAVVATGDYVKMHGTVKIHDGKIYLDDCECEIITCASERK